MSNLIPVEKNRHEDVRDLVLEKKKKSRSKSPETHKIHVDNLTRNVNSGHLEEIFGYFGKIKKVEIIVDRRTSVSQGAAYVDFYKKEEADAVVNYMNGGQVDGNKITVQITIPAARPTNRHSPVGRRQNTWRRGPSPRRRRSQWHRNSPRRSPRRRSPPRRSPVRRSPVGRRRSPYRSRSPSRSSRSPARRKSPENNKKSPQDKKSPARKSPAKKSPARKSPARKSPTTTRKRSRSGSRSASPKRRKARSSSSSSQSK